MNQTIDKIRKQMIPLKIWEYEMKNSLQITDIKTQNIFIIKKEWLDEYLISIFQKEFNKNEEIIKLYKTFDFKDNKIPIAPSLKDYKSVYALNEETWKYFVQDKTKNKSNKFTGEFHNNILIVRINEEGKIYCFFFYDQNNYLRQGYIKIYRADLEIKMIDELKSDDIFEFFKKHSIKYDKVGLQLFSYFEVIIFNLDKIENNTKEIKIKPEVIMSEIKKNIEGIKKEIDVGRMTNFNINNKLELNDDAIKDNDFRYTCTFAIKDKQKLKNKKNNKKGKIKKAMGNLKDFFPSRSKDSAFPGIKGLKNVGATCYMNATLQCFSNIDKIRSELIDKYENFKANKKLLSSALAEVIYNLWVKLDSRKYSPDNFKKTISTMNPLFKGVAANDPKDLILFILMTIHSETNEINQINNNNNEQPPDPSSFMAVYNDFEKYCSNQNNSIISNEFYGYTDNMTICAFCRKTIHNIQLVNILFFPLEEIRKFKGYNENVSIPIINCFEYYEKYETFPSFYCNYCKNSCNAYSNSKLIKAPNTLIINLNRGKGLEFNVGVTFEEYLDIKQFICSYDSPNYYELKGVISHFGSNDDGGHFIAYCKNSNNCKWYKYNDEIVEECNFNDLLTKGMPYVLFYSHIVVDDIENPLYNDGLYL